MPVSSTTTKVSAPTNGSATIYSFSPLVIFDDTQLEVVQVLDSSGAETVIPKGTGSAAYAIVVTGDYPQVGSIRYPEDEVTPVPSGSTIVMKRVLPLLQSTILAKQGGYFAKTQENQFDRLVMLDLQQQELIDRAIKLPVGASSGISTELPAVAADQFLKWNAAGDAITTAAAISGTAIASDLTPVDSNTTGGIVGVGTDYVREDHEHQIPTGSAVLAYLLAAGTALANVFTKTQTWKQGADVASAAALPVNIDGNLFDVTGTDAITSMDTKGVGTSITLQFDDVLVLTHHATNLILPGVANITTAAGDIAEFYEYATGDWRCKSYTRADGSSLLAGSMVQIVHVLDAIVGTGTTVMVGDDSKPQITEGDEYMTLAITPKSTANILYIDVTLNAATDVANTLIVALFQDAIADALAAVSIRTGTVNNQKLFTFRYRMVAGTTSAITFRVRAGGVGAGTITFNGGGGVQDFDGVSASTITITEVKP